MVNFCSVFFLYKLIPYVFILVSQRAVTSLPTTSWCYWLKLNYFFIIYPFFSIQTTQVLHYSQPLCCQYMKSCSSTNTGFMSVKKLPPKLTKSQYCLELTGLHSWCIQTIIFLSACAALWSSAGCRTWHCSGCSVNYLPCLLTQQAQPQCSIICNPHKSFVSYFFHCITLW